MSVYTVAVTLAIIVPSLNLINYSPDLYFVLFSAALLFINTTVLCLVFLPKVGTFVDDVFSSDILEDDAYTVCKQN